MRDTIDMAREAGGREYGNANPDIESSFILKDDQIKAFESLVRSDEREACAKVCDELVNDENTDEYINAADWCAVRIRARGENK